MRSSFNFQHVQFSLDSGEKLFHTGNLPNGWNNSRWRRSRASLSPIRVGHLSIWPERSRSFHGLSHTDNFASWNHL